MHIRINIARGACFNIIFDMAVISPTAVVKSTLPQFGPGERKYKK
jgi:hypothetical protein